MPTFNEENQVIVPESPNVIPGEQLYLYVPVATGDNAGIASFEEDNFELSEGHVKIKQGYLNNFVKVKLSKLSLSLTDDYEIKLGYTDEKGNFIAIYTLDAHIGLLLSKMIGNISITRNELTNTYTLSINRDTNAPGTGDTRIAYAQFSLPSNLATEEQVDEKVETLEEKSVIKDKNGNVVITGNLDVQGEINKVNTNVMTADSPISIVNASALDGETPVDWRNGGIVIILSEEADENGFDAFGFVYNKTAELPLATLGKYKDGVFTANNPAKYIALSNGERSLNSVFPIVKEDGSIAPSKYNADSFVQHRKNAHILYATDAKTNDVSVTMDVVNGDKVVTQGAIPRRTSRGTLFSSNDAQTDKELVRYSQLNGVEYRINRQIENINDRVSQLESSSLKYTEFSGVTDAVPVPANSARYAIIEKIGGMAYKIVSDNLWDTKSTVTSGNGITVNENGSITLNGEFEYHNIPIPSSGCLSLGTTELDDNPSNWVVVNLMRYREEEGSWDETNIPFVNGSCHWSSFWNASLILNGTFDDITIYPMLVSGTEPKPYEPFSKILLSTDVTSVRSEEANGTLVDSITVPDAVKDKLPEHFEFGDGIDENNCNYLDTLTETVYGNVARMVLDGSEVDAFGNSAWRVKTNSSTGITRFQINYSEASGGLGYPYSWIKYKDNGSQDTSVETPAICNAYESVSASANNNGAKGIAFSSTTLFIHDPAFSTLDAWKAHLKNNPLTVVYKVATPETKDVSNIISDAFNRIAVRSLGKVKPMSDSGMAATMTVAFVEAKGVE
jgi:hypothetical protein